MAPVFLLEIYQSIVFFKPSLNFVFALKPNSLSAFEVSSILLGWPSGFVLSQTIPPLNPVNLAINSTKSFIDISKPAPIFTGSGLLYLSVASAIASAQSSTYKNSLVGLPVPQTTTAGGESVAGTTESAYSLLLTPVLASIHFLIRAG